MTTSVGAFPSAIVLVMLVAMSRSDAADANLSITGRSNVVERSVEVSLLIDSPVPVGAVRLELLYPAQNLKLETIDAGAFLSSALIDSKLVEPGRVRIGFVTNEAILGNGEILTVTFSTTPETPESLSFSIEQAQGWRLDNSAELTFAVSDGSFRLKEPAQPVPSGSATPASVESEISPPLPGWVYFVGGAGLSLILVLLILVLQGKR